MKTLLYSIGFWSLVAALVLALYPITYSADVPLEASASDEQLFQLATTHPVLSPYRFEKMRWSSEGLRSTRRTGGIHFIMLGKDHQAYSKRSVYVLGLDPQVTAGLANQIADLVVSLDKAGKVTRRAEPQRLKPARPVSLAWGLLLLSVGGFAGMLWLERRSRGDGPQARSTPTSVAAGWLLPLAALPFLVSLLAFEVFDDLLVAEKIQWTGFLSYQINHENWSMSSSLAPLFLIFLPLFAAFLVLARFLRRGSRWVWHGLNVVCCHALWFTLIYLPQSRHVEWTPAALVPVLLLVGVMAAAALHPQSALWRGIDVWKWLPLGVLAGGTLAAAWVLRLDAFDDPESFGTVMVILAAMLTFYAFLLSPGTRRASGITPYHADVPAAAASPADSGQAGPAQAWGFGVLLLLASVFIAYAIATKLRTVGDLGLLAGIYFFDAGLLGLIARAKNRDACWWGFLGGLWLLVSLPVLLFLPPRPSAPASTAA